MPGKKPKERQRYMLRVNDTLVEVTRAVYLAWYQAGRKERYQVEKMQRHGVCSMEELQEKGMTALFRYYHRKKSLSGLSEIQELQEALEYLTEEEWELITLLFFEEYTVKKTAQYFRVLYKDDQKQEKQSIAETKRTGWKLSNFCMFQKNFLKKFSNRLIFALSHMRLVKGQMSIFNSR